MLGATGRNWYGLGPFIALGRGAVRPRTAQHRAAQNECSALPGAGGNRFRDVRQPAHSAWAPSIQVVTISSASVDPAPKYSSPTPLAPFGFMWPVSFGSPIVIF